MITKQCQICNKSFSKKTVESRKYWTTKKYCSRQCSDFGMIGRKHTEEYKKHMSSVMRGKRNSLGTVRSYEYRKHLSDYWTNNPKHNHWIDGKGYERISLRNQDMARMQYRDWRKSVFERDNYTCIECGKRGIELHADHIKPYSLFPSLRYETENGRTLCVKCHRRTETYGGKIKNYQIAI